MNRRLVGEATRLGRAGVRHLSAANLLVAYLVLLFLLPARLVFPGMGAAGRPAVVMGLGFLVWWVFTRLHPGLTTYGRQPVRVILLALVLTLLVSYVLGLDRGLKPLEASSADRYLIVLGSWLGVALIAADGLRERREVRRVLTWLTALAAIAATVGLLQFYNIDLAPYFRLPGLTYNDGLAGLGQRGGPGFNRVYGTQAHYIEFGVVLAMVLPLAIHGALSAYSRGSSTKVWIPVALIAAAIPLSISRAASLGLVTGFLFLSIVWPRSLRFKMLGAAGFGVLAFHLVTPGVLGTIKSAFLNFSNDPSITARIDDYAATDSLIADRPWFGRGPGTYVPELYRVLDNQFLWSVLEVGYVGAVALAGVFLGAVAMGRHIRKWAADDIDAHLGQALAASALVAFVASFTFDSLYFPTFAGMVFTVLGVSGALWRTCRHQVEDDHGNLRLTAPKWNLLSYQR